LAESVLENRSKVDKEQPSHPQMVSPKMVATGLEPTTFSPGKTGFLETGAAESGAVDARAVQIQSLADDLRSRFSADECRQLAALLTAESKPKGER